MKMWDEQSGVKIFRKPAYYLDKEIEIEEVKFLTESIEGKSMKI